MINAIAVFKEDLNFKVKNKLEVDPGERYLETLAVQGPFYAFIAEKKKGIERPCVFRTYFDRAFDRSIFINETFVFIASKVFGNTVGLISFREGLLKNLPIEEKAEIISPLHPLDVLLEKTPFRLTDHFIPGHYGHVAIWVGDENDLLVLRDNKLTDDMRREYIVRAFEQIEKEYDFNFDVETESKIVCSEIVYVVFHDIDWATKKALGRYTISPDNVTSKALAIIGPETLEPSLMYRWGKKEAGSLVPEIKAVLSVPN